MTVRAAASIDSAPCADGSPSPATSRCRCRGRAAALQVLRVRDAPAPPARAGRGRAAARPRRAARRQGAARAHRRDARRTTPACARGSPRSASRTSSATSCGRASARSSAGCCPHTNLGALVARRPRPPARGHGAPGPDARVAPTPTSSPTRARRPSTRRCGWPRSATAGELKIPFTSGILVGIGESEADRMASLEALAGLRPPPGGHPPELRPAPPLLRRGAGRDRHRGRRGATGAPGSTTGPHVPAPAGPRRSPSRTWSAWSPRRGG